jgi:hypothetical protein
VPEPSNLIIPYRIKGRRELTVGMDEERKVALFDKLPDDLIIKIFGYSIKNETDISRLRQTCKRFCRIVNGNLLTQPDAVPYGPDWDGTCVQCVKIFAIANFKFAKCNTIFMIQPLERCCYNTLRTLKSKLNTITGLVLWGSIDLTLLSRLLASLKNVHRLRLFCWAERSVDSARTARQLDRTLSRLEVDGHYLTERSALFNFPSEHICVRYSSECNVGWIMKYLHRHQKIVSHAKVIIAGIGDSPCIAELSEAMKSLGFNVKIIQDFMGNVALDGFKTSTQHGPSSVNGL